MLNVCGGPATVSGIDKCVACRMIKLRNENRLITLCPMTEKIFH